MQLGMEKNYVLRENSLKENLQYVHIHVSEHPKKYATHWGDSLRDIYCAQLILFSALRFLRTRSTPLTTSGK